MCAHQEFADVIADAGARQVAGAVALHWLAGPINQELLPKAKINVALVIMMIRA